MLTEQEREWIVAGMAWVALQRWVCGQKDGDAARAWFQDQMDVRLGDPNGVLPLGLSADMERLAAEMKRRMILGVSSNR